MKRSLTKTRKMYRSIIIFGFVILQSSQSVYGSEESKQNNHNDIISDIAYNSNDNLSLNSNPSIRTHKNEFVNDSNELTESEQKEEDHDKEASYTSNFILNTILSTTSFQPPTTAPSVTDPILIPIENFTLPFSGVLFKTTTNMPESTLNEMSAEETTLKTNSERDPKRFDGKTNVAESPEVNNSAETIFPSSAEDSDTSLGHIDDDIEEEEEEDTTLSNKLEIDAKEESSEQIISETQTTLPPTFLSKQIRVLKMSPDEILRNFVSDINLRTPIAALVDRKQNPLIKAKQLWRASLIPNAPLEIILISYDGEGESI